MKRLFLAVPVALLALACGRETAAQKKDDSEAPASAPPNSVHMSLAVQKKVGIVLETVRIQSVPEVLRSPARLTNNENQTWRVGAVTEGRVVRVRANPGDRVSRGQVLARMHSHEIHESRAEFTRAKAELARAQSRLTYAQRLRDRAARLLELKAGSVEQLEHAETELRDSQTAVRNAEVDVDRTRRHLTEFLGIPAEELGDHVEDEEHDLIPVRAPADGVVLTRSVTPGTVVSAASEMFVISDLSSLWAVAEVQEEHLSKVRVGMPVRLFVQAYRGRAFAGRIDRLGDVLDPGTRTVQVRVLAPNPGRLLKPEMYATAEISLGEAASGLFVPSAAVQEVRGQPVVFVRRGETEFEAIPVELGTTIGEATQVVRGLSAGDEIAAAGSFILKSELLKASLAEDE